MKDKFIAGLAASLFVAVLPAHAQQASKDEAIALVEKAAAHLKKNGVETACKDFADAKGGFIHGELYIFVQDMNAKMICHAANARMNGKDLAELKDADGKKFSKAMAELAQAKGSGWVDYQWVNPVTKVIEPKTSYIQRVNEGVFLGAGIYRK